MNTIRINRTFKIIRTFRTTLYIIAVFFLATFCTASAQNNKSSGIPDLSGSWKFEKIVRQNKKIKSRIELISFSLTIKQNGDKITGKYEYLTTNATRIREGSISGKIFGVKGIIRFENPEYSNENGLADLVPSKKGDGDEINWVILQAPQGDSFIPAKLTLKKGK
ncbi:MAG: hypothetical protein LWY06_00630 [Firmicutes bacterium]|nr:hypothetical protein [Bacillota bacterium]